MTELQTIPFFVEGKKPSESELDKYSKLTYGNGFASGVEIKEALKWIAGGIFIAIFGFFFGTWVADNFIGPGVLFFGYGFMLGGPIIGLLLTLENIYKIFRSARKKMLQKLLNGYGKYRF